MRVCIIGWYGTETLGDRAILAGMLAFLSEVSADIQVSLGSLHPFFSERTLVEDQPLWKTLTGREVPVELFNSSKPGPLKRAIQSSDLLLMGGGPLMDLREMHMVAFAFRYARRKKVRTGIFGCGIGPLKKPSFQKAAADILAHSDFAVFRDSLAEAEARKLCRKSDFRSCSAIDPAAYCARLFKEKYMPLDTQNRISINLRAISWEYDKVVDGKGFNDFAVELVDKVVADNPESKVLLIPHHYFFFGGDDRVLMNTIKYRIGNREILVQNKPLSLQETMSTFASSTCCVGMRFHAMLLMPLLNGRCRVINYTGDQSGKIRGYLNDFDPNGFFDSRRVLSLDAGEWDLSIFDNMLQDDCFESPDGLLDKAFQTYRTVLAEHT
ncbi:MAG: polysaccharide pyruvyl transferase family protein [Kiritimatiellales bacterium]|nr:polysaccharide pyruvyl transferase family protein [Kiritimatiellales bacterium]